MLLQGWPSLTIELFGCYMERFLISPQLRRKMFMEKQLVAEAPRQGQQRVGNGVHTHS
jgi:hypothetical protein